MAEAKTYRLVITSVGELLLDEQVVSGTFPGTSGMLTVLAHHEALVTTLDKGTVNVELPDGERKEFLIVRGVLEVAGNKATILL